MLLLALLVPLVVLLALLGMERVERWVTDGVTAPAHLDVAGDPEADGTQAAL